MPSKRTRSHRPKSLAAYLEAVEAVKNQWYDDEGKEFRIWYRGHNDTRWPLLPGIYREQYRDLGESSCRRDFQLRAYPYLAGTAREPSSEWDWYFLMQHHGLPTRLLDWSESLLVALYFALRDASGSVDAAVWMLDPWCLNRTLADLGDRVLLATDPTARDYLTTPFSGIALPEPPIALEAPHASRRIAAQRGTFTMHGNAKRALETYARADLRLKKIEIPKSSVAPMRRALRDAGVTETTVFPELPSLCRELLDYWNE